MRDFFDLVKLLWKIFIRNIQNPCGLFKGDSLKILRVASKPFPG